MKTRKTALTVALGSAFAASLAAAPIANAAENPFGMQVLDKGYQVADAKGKEGNCGGMKGKDGSCGGMKKGAAKSAEDTEANKKMMKEGKCGEGKCGVKNLKEGKCGEGKCGGMKK